MSYWNDEKHGELIENYDENNYGAMCLGFTKEWMDANLPAGNAYGVRPLNIFLRDRTDGKIYQSKIYAAYAEDAHLMDKGYTKHHDMWALMSYFYGSHHCPCHRKHDARAEGAVVEEDLECEGDRFQIHKITCDKYPNLVLLSETMTFDELQNALDSMKTSDTM